jgi:hypothetical protein
MSDTSMMRMKVLVLDAGSAAGLETVQSLGRVSCIFDTPGLRAELSRHRSRFIRGQRVDPSGARGAALRRIDFAVMEETGHES